MLYTIYKIYSDECDYVYVGSTKNLTMRKHKHKSSCNNEKDKSYNCKVYETIRNNGGWNNFKLVPIEEFECDTKQQSLIREQHWITELKPKMNSCNALQDGEYYKIYREANYEALNEYQKAYKEANRDKINEKGREYKKAYREANYEALNEYQKAYQKAYREANKEAINEKARERRRLAKENN